MRAGNFPEKHGSTVGRWASANLQCRYGLRLFTLLAEAEHHLSSTQGRRLKVTEALLAAFTFMVFGATALLWRATRGLVEGAEDTAERQLRAYVHARFTEKTTHVVAGQKITCEMIIENSGQTPAYDVHSNTNICAADFPFSGLPPLTYVPGAGSRNVIHPRQTFTTTAESDSVLSAEDLRSAMEGTTKRLYLYGEVRYRDIFGEARYTRFRLMSPPGLAHPRATFGFCHEGNEAN
jgi:hypothetical protein